MKFCPGGIDKGIHVARVTYSTALNMSMSAVDRYFMFVVYDMRIRIHFYRWDYLLTQCAASSSLPVYSKNSLS